MRTPNYLHLAPSGVYHYRRRHGGKILTRSLHTRDRLTAQRLALALAALYRAGMGNPFDDLFKNARTFEINGPGGLRVKTNGTREDNDAAVRALEALRVAWPPGVAERLGQPQKAAREAVAPSVKLGAAVKAWKNATKPETDDPGQWKTFGQKCCAVDVFAQAVGTSRNVNELSQVDLGNHFAALREGRLTPRPLSLRTLDTKASYLGGFFDYCKSRGWCEFDDNPAGGHVPKSTATKRLWRKNGRKPFTRSQIAAVFDPDALAFMQPPARWGALIGLYTGARVSEVGQLALHDFDRVAGVPVFHIRDDTKGQSLKTESSRRTIPIHPDLITLGLLERVAQLRAAGETQLFPNANPKTKNGMGNWLSASFRRHLKKQGMTRDKGKFGFHSLRKTYTQELQNLRVPSEYRAALDGHDLGDVHHSVYSRAPTIEELLQAVEPLSFGLDLKAIKRVLWDEKQKRQSSAKKGKK